MHYTYVHLKMYCFEKSFSSFSFCGMFFYFSLLFFCFSQYNNNSLIRGSCLRVANKQCMHTIFLYSRIKCDKSFVILQLNNNVVSTKVYVFEVNAIKIIKKKTGIKADKMQLKMPATPFLYYVQLYENLFFIKL